MRVDFDPALRPVAAERAVLGSILLNKAVWWRLGELTASDFGCGNAGVGHAAIFAAMALLVEESRPIDYLTVRDELTRTGQLQLVGGISYVTSLTDSIPDVANVESYVEIVRRQAAKRFLVVLAEKMKSQAADADAEPEAVAADVIAALNPRVAKESAHAKPLVEIVDDAFRTLQRRESGESAGKITSGYSELDFANVFRRGALTVIGAPSHHAKTAVCVNTADGLARNGHSTVFFTLESTESEVGLRWASKTAQVPHSRTQDFGRLLGRDDERSRLREASAEAGRRPLRVTRAVRTVEGMYAECRRLKTLHGLDAAIIDYLQIVRTVERIRDWEERLACIAQLLLEYAIDLDISIIATSQVNKDFLNRPVHRPLPENPRQTEIVGYDMHQEDLKRCAALGETARVVILFNRPFLLGCRRNRKGDEIRQCYMDFKIAKNNENITNPYDAHFDEVTQTFGMGICAENGCGDAKPEQKRMFG